MTSAETSREVAVALRALLDSRPELREPMNALVVWTELGRGLAGTLDRKGADVELLGRLIAGWCKEEGAAQVTLEARIPAVPKERRLSHKELVAALQLAEAAIAEKIDPFIAEHGKTGQRDGFIAVVRGWFAVGVGLVRALPGVREAPVAEQLGVLSEWCTRYFPRDTSGPAELGVRIEK